MAERQGGAPRQARSEATPAAGPGSHRLATLDTGTVLSALHGISLHPSQVACRPAQWPGTGWVAHRPGPDRPLQETPSPFPSQVSDLAALRFLFHRKGNHAERGEPLLQRHGAQVPPP